MDQPPQYTPHAGYPPPQAGYPPQHAGYPPPQAGYPPQQAGYPPQGFQTPQQQQQVLVVQNQPAAAPAQNTVIVTNQHVRRDEINHCLHCIISIFFPPWLLVWFCLCICS